MTTSTSPVSRTLANRLVGRAHAHRPDSGVAKLEYLGVLVVAALLITGVLAASFVAFPEHARWAVCTIDAALQGNPGSSSCASPEASGGDTPTDEDFTPEACMLNAATSSSEAAVTVAFFKVGTNWGLESETYSDGRVRVTVSNGLSGGVTAKAGGDVGGLGAEVEGSGELGLKFGDTWEYTAEEWEAAEQEMRAYLDTPQWKKWLGSGSWWGPRKPRDPDIRQTELGLDVAVSGSLSAEAPIEGAEDLSLGIGGASVNAGAGRSAKIETDTRTGEQSYIFEGTLEAGAQADVLSVGASVERGVTATFKVTKNDRDQVISIEYQTVTEGGESLDLGTSLTETGPLGKDGTPTFQNSVGGSYSDGQTRVVVSTTTLAVDHTNRAMVEDWLGRHGGGAFVGLPYQEVVPDEASDDEFWQHMYEQARTSRALYDAEGSEVSVGASVSAGVGVGVEASTSEGSRELTEASFLGAPGVDGKRPFVSNDTCR